MTDRLLIHAAAFMRVHALYRDKGSNADLVEALSVCAETLIALFPADQGELLRQALHSRR